MAFQGRQATQKLSSCFDPHYAKPWSAKKCRSTTIETVLPLAGNLLFMWYMGVIMAVYNVTESTSKTRAYNGRNRMNIKGGFHYSLYSLSLRWGLMDTNCWMTCTVFQWGKLSTRFESAFIQTKWWSVIDPIVADACVKRGIMLSHRGRFNVCHKLLKTKCKQTADNTVNTHFHCLIWFIGFLKEPHPSLPKAS